MATDSKPLSTPDVSRQVTGMILAGGRGRRMQGADKGLMDLDGTPMIAHVIGRLRPQVETLFISANRHLDRYGDFGHPVVADELEGFQGPLAGIASICDRVRTEYLLVVPCDVPGLPHDLCRRLVRACESAGARAAVVSDGRRQQHLCLLLHHSVFGDLRAAVKIGERQVRAWVAGQAPAVVDFSDCAECFSNINYAEDRHRFITGRTAARADAPAGTALEAAGVHLPVLGFAAYSGTGKTTLLTRLIPALVRQGLRVGVLKHAHHRFDLDQPGKDSFELRKSGARQTVVASGERCASITETPENAGDPDFHALLRGFDADRLDLILVEGFRHERFPKIELHRPGLGRPLLYPRDPSIIAIACDGALQPRPPVPVLDLNRDDLVAEFVLDYLRKFHGRHRAGSEPE